MTSGWLLRGSCCRYGACARQIVSSELSSCSIPNRKEYDQRVAAARELLQIRGMRPSDFLAEYEDPREHFMTSTAPVREGNTP